VLSDSSKDQQMPGSGSEGQDQDDWVGLLSDDGRWRWDGQQWQPVEEPPAPPSPAPPTPEPPVQEPAWPTPWGGLDEDPKPQPRPPVETGPPLTRASLFGPRPAPAEDPGSERESEQKTTPTEPPRPEPADEEQPAPATPPVPSPPLPGQEARTPPPLGEEDPLPPPPGVAAPIRPGMEGVPPPPPLHEQASPPAPPLPTPEPGPLPAAEPLGQELAPWDPAAAGPPVPTQPGQQDLVPSANISSDRMLRRPAPAPDSGFRRLVFNVSRGRINMGPSTEDVRRRQLLALVRTRVNTCRRIAVISRKGGIGKTTTTLMLGHQFASVRGDRVVALDGNPDAGSLADRVVRETDSTVTDVLREGDRLVSYSDVRAFTSQASSRLEVVASDNDPRISEALGDEDYRGVMEVLGRHYSLILCDTGTGILDKATRGILSMADQIVLCAAPSLDASRVSASTLDWLERHGYGRLAQEAVVAINAVRPGGPVELDLLQRFFEDRCRAVVRIPWDPRLSAGAETTLDELHPATRTAYLNLAAMVAAGFAR
jgi:putative peptide zinc metalloprotease protein